MVDCECVCESEGGIRRKKEIELGRWDKVEQKRGSEADLWRVCLKASNGWIDINR